MRLEDTYKKPNQKIARKVTNIFVAYL